MSLDFDLERIEVETVASFNMTHNLAPMAEAAGLYNCLWRPAENGYVCGRDVIEPIQKGLQKLLAEPEKFKALNPPNGWGDYDGFVESVGEILQACIGSPDAIIRASR